MKTQFIQLISSGNFSAAKQLLYAMQGEEVINFLIDLTFETNLVGIYTVILFILLDNESIFFHEAAIGVLTVSMWEGANASAFLHTRRIVELSPNNITKKQDLLAYFGTPDCTMSYEEAKSIAQEILIQDPTNITALSILRKLEVQ